MEAKRKNLAVLAETPLRNLFCFSKTFKQQRFSSVVNLST